MGGFLFQSSFIAFLFVLLHPFFGTLTPVAASCMAKAQSQLLLSAGYTIWPTEQGLSIGRSLKQLSPSPEVEPTVQNTTLILASDRTARHDPLDNFHRYRQGWDIRNEHYWASVGFTGAPGFIVAAVWLALGLVLLLLLFCCCCCCRDRMKGPHQGGTLVPLLLLLIFTGTAVLGCVLVYTAQGKFHNELSDTLDFVVEQSEIVVGQLRNTSAALTEAQTIDVVNFVLSDSDKAKIQQLNAQLTNAADDLHRVTDDNAHKIQTGLNNVRLAMIVVAGVMLLLVLLGLLFSTLGAGPLVYLLVFLGWFLVAGTWILCGVYILLNNAIGDTCISMEEWVDNPSAKTSLDDILPCVDINTANNTLDQTRRLTNETVTGINNVIANYLNAGSSQAMPLLCNPVEQLPLSGCVNLTGAPEAWSPYVCNSSGNQTCPLQGRLTQNIDNQLIKSVNVINGLYTNIPFLVKLEDCQFARGAFTTIVERYCHPLRKYSKWQYIGLALISGGCMFSIILWIVFIRMRRHRHTRGQPMYRGTAPLGESKPV